ncbi:MAG TPA: DNA-3-methyladenine glycosylase [Candidatus Dormibacteraeota bacterium]
MPRAFFARATEVVAPELIGCGLVADAGSRSEVVAVIVEVEAYLGVADPASHAHRGPTPRARIMFGEAGRLYVYLSYGLHHCANVVTEATGVAGAVLLRAAAVESGTATVRERRLRVPRRGEAHGGGERAGAAPRGAATPFVSERRLAEAALLRGPGNLCCGLGIQLADNGLDLCARGPRLRVVARLVDPPVARSRRVGVSVATEAPLRFSWAGHPAVSRQAAPVGGRGRRRASL